jgi:hypothetical protein
MDHQRIVPRRRILKAGSIPDRFTLVVRTDQLKRPCHVIWRKEKRIGVAFD